MDGSGHSLHGVAGDEVERFPGATPGVAAKADMALQALARFTARCADTATRDGTELRSATRELRLALAQLLCVPTQSSADLRAKWQVQDRLCAGLFEGDPLVSDFRRGLLDEFSEFRFERWSA